MSVNYTTIVVVYQVYVDRNTWHVQTEKIIYYATEWLFFTWEGKPISGKTI